MNIQKHAFNTHTQKYSCCIHLVAISESAWIHSFPHKCSFLLLFTILVGQIHARSHIFLYFVDLPTRQFTIMSNVLCLMKSSYLFSRKSTKGTFYWKCAELRRLDKNTNGARKLPAAPPLSLSIVLCWILYFLKFYIIMTNIYIIFIM